MEKVMVVRNRVLFSEKVFEGFIPASEFNFEKVILENFKWMERKIAEGVFSYKQPIGYSVIYNQNLGKFFFYQRSKKDDEYKEKRLQGKWSCGVGGHIGKEDLGKTMNPIRESMLREIKEEVGIKDSVEIETLGYLNYNTDNVGKVHFGILYLVHINDSIIRVVDPEINRGELRSFEEIEKMIRDENLIVEEWTKTTLKVLKAKFFS